MSTNGERRYGLDLLRIVSMIFVIGLHYFYNCSIEDLQSFSFNFVINWLLEAVCYTSVDIFILITGYFGICSKRQNYRRMMGLVTGVWFYSWIGLAGYLLINKKAPISFINTSVFPICNGHYWFVSVYIILMLLQPAINKLLYPFEENRNDSEVAMCDREWDAGLKITVLLVVMFCLIPTVFPKADPNFKLNGGTHIVWFITLYCIGGMIRKHEAVLRNKKVVSAILIVSLLVPVAVKVTAMGVFGISQGGAVFYHHNSLFIISSAVCLFLLFKDLDIKSNKCKRHIRSVSKATFGVYLIHENLAIKEYLWKTIRIHQDLNSAAWGVSAIVVILIIFIICAAIESFRLTIIRITRINDLLYELIIKLILKVRKRVGRWASIE